MNRIVIIIEGGAVHLSSYCDWEIVKLSETGQLILVPTKKES